jgi:BirA family biotin operon repressor/biotin-[acetyl-CoA-carboxylase] ligase
MSLRDKLLQALEGGSAHALSGQKLARQLGVSRTAVWKQIKTLRRLGLPLERAGRDGYRQCAPLDGTLARYRGPAWTTPHYFLSTASTQALAKAGAAAGLPEGHLWITETQTKGRGRLDRLWESAYGGLWFSLLLRPKLSPARVAPITLLAGLALRQAVCQACAVDFRLKWPNDLLVLVGGRWKKCAGTLTEMSGQMERTEWVVIGVGVNVNNVLSADLSARAASLYSLTGRTWPRAEILDAFLTRFRAAYARFSSQGFAPFRDLYWAHYAAPGEPVCLKTAEGDVRGRAVGVDTHGAIMIESRRKTRAFHEGEIVL